EIPGARAHLADDVVRSTLQLLAGAFERRDQTAAALSSRGELLILLERQINRMRSVFDLADRYVNAEGSFKRLVKAFDAVKDELAAAYTAAWRIGVDYKLITSYLPDGQPVSAALSSAHMIRLVREVVRRFDPGNGAPRHLFWTPSRRELRFDPGF